MSHKKDKEGSSSETNANVNNISVTNRQLNVRPFQINENRNATASDWEKWPRKYPKTVSLLRY